MRPDIATMYRYVGAANSTPASRIPRRLPSVSRAIIPTAQSTRWSWTSGMKLETAATPAAVDTATVRT
jgi:hypothetical protein